MGIYRYAVLVSLVVAALASAESIAKATCWDGCVNTLQVGTEEYGEDYCCRLRVDGTSEIKESPCHPLLDPGGFSCWSWKGRWLEDGGCWTLGDPVEEGMNCYDASIAMAVKDLESCDFAAGTCTYGDEYMDSTGTTVCWECPSEGPPRD